METVGTMLQERPVSRGTFYLEDNSKHNITSVIQKVQTLSVWNMYVTIQ